MPIPILKGKSGPLSATDIHIGLLSIEKTVGHLSVLWGVPKENISRVINSTPGFSFPKIRQNLARLLDVPVEWIGREASPQQRKRAATLARKEKKSTVKLPRKKAA